MSCWLVFTSGKLFLIKQKSKKVFYQLLNFIFVIIAIASYYKIFNEHRQGWISAQIDLAMDLGAQGKNRILSNLMTMVVLMGEMMLLVSYFSVFYSELYLISMFFEIFDFFIVK